MKVFSAHTSIVAVAAGVLVAMAGACGGAPPLGPDALRPDTFQLIGVGANPLPTLAYTTAFGGSVWLESAQLKSVEPGRTIDPRIFEDRSGNGPSGGGTRDSTTVSARMADVRVFQERSGATIVATRRDSSGVIVERRGDLLLVRREHPDPSRQRVDTGRFDAGALVLPVRTWETNGVQLVNGAFTYKVATIGN